MNHFQAFTFDDARLRGRRCPLRSAVRTGSNERIWFEQVEPRRLLSTFTVTSTADSGAGSLRAAITSANAAANSGGVPDIIAFALTGAGPFTIALTSALPTITDPVDIDGYSQTGAIKNSNDIDQPFNGVLRIVLDGINAPAGTNGLNIDAGDTTVQGLVIARFPGNGIRITSNSGNTITGNFIGTDITGTIDRGNGNDGIQISGVRNNRIGGTLPQHRNVISGNGSDGVEIGGTGSISNLVIGNFIGVNVTGDAALGNSSDGISVVLGATLTQIGGGTAPERNVIAANGSDGIELNGAATTGNTIAGNYIGIDLTGTLDLGNAVNGIAINASPNNLVGGTTAGHRNVVSGNEDDGVDVSNGAVGNVIQGNYLGTDAGGSADLGNRSDGISITNSTNTLVGGAAAGAGNVIGGNGSDGVKIIGAATTGTKIEGNFIGLAADGATARGNDGDGVFIQQGAAATTIGGTAVNAGNRIAFNGQNGVGLAADAGNGNAVLGNVLRGNALLAIDLSNNGITANDPAPDADAGPNRLQNFPVLTQASLAGSPTIVGTLDSAANAVFRIEFFANPAGAAIADQRQGRRFLGAVSVATDAAGHAAFNAALPGVTVAAGEFITATATATALGDTSEFAAPVVFTADGTPPIVTQVRVSGTTWLPSFVTFLQATGQGDGGYRLPATNQLASLPWIAIDQISIQFSESVNIQSNHLVLRGATVATQAVSGFAYDDATLTATWTFTSALTVDKWLIDLSAAVTDAAGTPLDGDWTNPPALGGTGDSFPSGDGTAGGAFRFRFNVVPGNVSQSGQVQSTDVIRTRNAQFRTTEMPEYSAFFDVDSSGAIQTTDLIQVRNRQFTLLPNGEPVVPFSAFSAPATMIAFPEQVAPGSTFTAPGTMSAVTMIAADATGHAPLNAEPKTLAVLATASLRVSSAPETPVSVTRLDVLQQEIPRWRNRSHRIARSISLEARPRMT